MDDPRALLRSRYPLRRPYDSEYQFFSDRPEVAGYAAEDSAVVLNPYSGLGPDQRRAVHTNEATRHHLADTDAELAFPVTARQADFFKGTPYGMPAPDYGTREDGTPKGRGWWGELTTPDGGVMTEWSADFDLNGRPVHAPLIVPSMTQREKELAAQEILTPAMEEKARAWAAYRTSRGQSPFAANHEGRDALLNTPQHTRHTILARIISGDPSAGPYTPEQQAAAESVLAGLLGAPR